MYLHVCVDICACVSIHVCAHAEIVADRGSPAWVESVAAQFGFVSLAPDITSQEPSFLLVSWLRGFQTIQVVHT